VDAKVLDSRPVTNLGQGLQGMVPNLNINPGSGALGRDVSFNIRGNTSINGGSPLILVDGVQMDPNLINPQDVQSVSVLKDAASASIYGARAAYGVILITTKNGRKNKKPVVSLSMNYATNRPTVVPKSMNSIEWTSWMNDGNMTSNGRPYFDDETMQHVKAYYDDPDNNATLIQHSEDPIGIFREVGNTDWSKELLKNTYPMQQYTGSVTGGSDKVTYYTSFGYLNQKGISKPGDENYNRFNVTQNISYEINKWINVRAKVAINGTDQKMNPSNSSNNFGGDEIYASYSAWPIVPVLAPDGNYDETKGYNMVAYLKNGGYQKQQTKDLWATGAIKLTPLKGLIINVDYTYNSYNRNYLNYRKQYYTRDNGAILLSPWGNISSVTRRNNDNRYMAFNAFAEYEKVLGKSYFKGLVGFNQEFGGFGSFQAERQSLINNDIPYASLARGDQFVTDAASEYAIRGTFARLNYSYDNRYLLELNGRYDGSSRFPKSNRFAFFPSVSAGWRISEESFFKGLKNTVNDLKLRASYGNLGNQTVASYYPYIATYGTGEVNYLFGGSRLVTAYAPGLVSPMLTWEKVSQYNFGLDFSLLNRRLTGSFDKYTRETKDMLTKSKSLPSVLATNEPQTNAADMKTKGFEVSLAWRDEFPGGFTYGLNVMLSDYISKITKYDNPQGLISDYNAGSKLGDIWGFETEGLFKTDEDAHALDQSEISGHEFLAGDIKFRDLDKDNKITRGNQTITNSGDLKVIGNSTPRYSYGFKADAGWKGFDLTLFFQGVGKRSVTPNSIYFLQHYTSEWAVPQKINGDYWTPENQDAYFPRARIGNADEITETQSRFLQNAAYLRLKQFTVGYSLPGKMIEKAKIGNVRFYFSGNNIWESTKMLDIFDPEGFASNMYPLTRSFSFGMNLTF
ncbi:MAG: TonB-dependent receptor, partial [Flavitalea sp.]